MFLARSKKCGVFLRAGSLWISFDCLYRHTREMQVRNGHPRTGYSKLQTVYRFGRTITRKLVRRWELRLYTRMFARVSNPTDCRILLQGSLLVVGLCTVFVKWRHVQRWSVDNRAKRVRGEWGNRSSEDGRPAPACALVRTGPDNRSHTPRPNKNLATKQQPYNCNITLFRTRNLAKTF